ncbi:unnamed protein product [Didymodactylos carnosus]|uniref:Uncharacterized protein n=1 Tax=Didymodactylos carnosus TaxID=1234261 RepID=A0A815QN07_9BILA|nr:unnamed protein product [Didymodactylos carnosus]CAF4334084.1 unnamed protein product [Didymodactylos carnosus]
MQLCDQIDPDMSDKTKLTFLTPSLRPSLRKKIIEKNPKTSEEFLKIAEEAEATQGEKKYRLSGELAS